MHNLSNEIMISQSDSEIVLKLKIVSESDYFDGHFPNFPLLPAVAQIDLIVHFANKYFDVKKSVKQIKRIKFAEKIFPNSELLLKIKFDSQKNKINFEISSIDEKISYSSGNYFV